MESTNRSEMFDEKSERACAKLSQDAVEFVSLQILRRASPRTRVALKQKQRKLEARMI